MTGESIKGTPNSSHRARRLSSSGSLESSEIGGISGELLLTSAHKSPMSLTTLCLALFSLFFYAADHLSATMDDFNALLDSDPNVPFPKYNDYIGGDLNITPYCKGTIGVQSLGSGPSSGIDQPPVPELLACSISLMEVEVANPLSECLLLGLVDCRLLPLFFFLLVNQHVYCPGSFDTAAEQRR